MKRPFKDYRPFGPFTDLGFQLSQNDNIQYTDTGAKKLIQNFDETDTLRQLDIQLEGECSNYQNLGGRAEFIIPFEDAVPVKTIGLTDKQQIYNEVHMVEQQHPDKFIGVHVTNGADAKSIVRNGFDSDKIGESTVAFQDIRQGSVFTWHFIYDIHETSMTGVITLGERENVVVSDMSMLMMTDFEDYLENYTMDYPDFIRCLKKPPPADFTMRQQDIIQDITDYNP